MPLRLRSLSEDNADAYSNTWAVAFFLMLALILLHNPKSSNYGNQHQEEFTVNCWCPAQFERSQVYYTNAICTAHFNNWVYRKPTAQLQLHLIPWSNEKSIESESEQESEKMGREQNLLQLQQTPVILFLVAICLRIPRLLMFIVMRCCNCLNVDRTLASAEKGGTMGLDERRQMYASLFKDIQSHTQRSQKTITLSYFIMKFVMIIVITGWVIALVVFAIPQLHITIENTKESHSNTSTPDKIASPIYSVTEADRVSLVRGKKQQAIFHCVYTLKQMQNHHDFEVQCLARRLEGQGQISFWFVQSNVLVIALVSLVFLLVFNIVNTLTWLMTLPGYSRKIGLGLRPDAPLDLVFLLQMARDNLSVGVATGLVESARHYEFVQGDAGDGGPSGKI